MPGKLNPLTSRAKPREANTLMVTASISLSPARPRATGCIDIGSTVRNAGTASALCKISRSRRLRDDHHTFDHETVQLDNRSFLNCDLIESTLGWNGNETHLEKVRFTGKIRFVIDNPQLAAGVKMIHEFEQMDPDSIEVNPTPLGKYGGH